MSDYTRDEALAEVAQDAAVIMERVAVARGRIYRQPGDFMAADFRDMLEARDGVRISLRQVREDLGAQVDAGLLVRLTVYDPALRRSVTVYRAGPRAGE